MLGHADSSAACGLARTNSGAGVELYGDAPFLRWARDHVRMGTRSVIPVSAQQVLLTAHDRESVATFGLKTRGAMRFEHGPLPPLKSQSPPESLVRLDRRVSFESLSLHRSSTMNHRSFLAATPCGPAAAGEPLTSARSRRLESPPARQDLSRSRRSAHRST